ncbi:MAG: hypothetical protein HY735_28210 [Verrucomicrobia bacterium]|nr:hypothetical protein [Verrucomicrobiota bacterium]
MRLVGDAVCSPQLGLSNQRLAEPNHAQEAAKRLCGRFIAALAQDFPLKFGGRMSFNLKRVVQPQRTQRGKPQPNALAATEHKVRKDI